MTNSIPLPELVPVLQIAIAPVILISGVGLFLLSLTNRFGRALDRTREIHHKLLGAIPSDHHRLSSQVDILYRRARMIQFSIIMAAVSALCAALLILTLFLAALLKWEASAVITLIFIGCLLSLIVSLIAFILDIRLALKALKLELARHPEKTIVAL